MNLDKIHCTAKKCYQNQPSYRRFKGYKKCSGCQWARILVGKYTWENYSLEKHRKLLEDNAVKGSKRP